MPESQSFATALFAEYLAEYQGGSIPCYGPEAALRCWKLANAAGTFIPETLHAAALRPPISSQTMRVCLLPGLQASNEQQQHMKDCDEANSLARLKQHLSSQHSRMAVCLICLEDIEADAAVWECRQSCYCMVHLLCIQVRSLAFNNRHRLAVPLMQAMCWKVAALSSSAHCQAIT